MTKSILLRLRMDRPLAQETIASTMSPPTILPIFLFKNVTLKTIPNNRKVMLRSKGQNSGLVISTAFSKPQRAPSLQDKQQELGFLKRMQQEQLIYPILLSLFLASYITPLQTKPCYPQERILLKRQKRHRAIYQPAASLCVP